MKNKWLINKVNKNNLNTLVIKNQLIKKTLNNIISFYLI